MTVALKVNLEVGICLIFVLNQPNEESTFLKRFPFLLTNKTDIKARFDLTLMQVSSNKLLARNEIIFEEHV